MKIIDAKKLIISTLIFLFSSFETPMLADNAPPPVVQETVTQMQAPAVDVTHITFMKDHAFSVQMAYPSWGLLQSLEGLIFAGTLPEIMHGPYIDGKDGYVLVGEKPDTQLETKLLPIIKAPEKYGIPSGVVAQKLFPKFFHARDCEGTLLSVPYPKEQVTILEKATTLISFYTAFKGFEGTRVHSKPLLTAEATFLQCLAANLIANLELILHIHDDTTLELLERHFAQNSGKSVREILAVLA